MRLDRSHGKFQDILGIADPALRPVCQALRSLIASHHPEFTEVVWTKLKIASFGVGPKKLTQHYAYIAVQAAHINLGFYHGASLDDPGGLLEGIGKALRHIKFRGLPGVQSAAVNSLLQQAIVERKPYA